MALIGPPPMRAASRGCGLSRHRAAEEGEAGGPIHEAMPTYIISI